MQNKEDFDNELKTLIKIIVGLLFIILIIFLFTKYVINDGDTRIPERISTEGQVISNNVTVGTMFNRPDKEYYVISLNQKNQKTAYFYSIVQEYMFDKDKATIYILDSNNKLNSSYLGDEVNLKATNINNIVITKSPILFKLKNGKIDKTYIDEAVIESKLK